ncbi:MAK10-like protein [Tanacetum coccineum]
MPEVKSIAVETNVQPKTQELEETQKDNVHLDQSGLEAPTLKDKLKLGEKGSKFISDNAPREIKDHRLFILPCRLGDSKPFDTLADLGSNVNLIPLCLYRTLNIGLLEGTNSTLVLADGSKACPIGLVRSVEVHIGTLKLIDDFYVLDMKQDPTCPLLRGRELQAAAQTMIDCREAKIMIGERSTKSTYAAIKQECGNEEESDWTTIVRCLFYTPQRNDSTIGPKKPCYLEDEFVYMCQPGKSYMIRDDELNPFKDYLLFRKMIDFLGTIPINLKGNKWKPKSVFNDKWDWKRPPKEGDGAWHIKIEIMDPDRKQFNKTFRTMLTIRKLSLKSLQRKHFNLKALGANGDVLEAFQGISRQIDEVRIDPGHEDTDFLKTSKTSLTVAINAV